MDIEVYGIPEVSSTGEYFDDLLYKAAMSALAGIPKKRRRDEDVIREAVRNAVRKEARNLWGKKPVTTVFVAKVSSCRGALIISSKMLPVWLIPWMWILPILFVIWPNWPIVDAMHTMAMI